MNTKINAVTAPEGVSLQMQTNSNSKGGNDYVYRRSSRNDPFCDRPFRSFLSRELDLLKDRDKTKQPVD